MSKHLNALVHSTILYLPAQCVPPIVQFVTTVYWTYLLDPATFGFVNFIISIQEIVAFFGLTGWTLFVLRFRERFRSGNNDRFVAMDQRMTASSCLIQFVLAPVVLNVLGMPCDAATIAATAAYLITKMLVSHYSDWARADHAIGAYTAAQLIGSICGLGLWLAAIPLFGATAAVVIGAQALGQALALAALVLLANVRFGAGVFDKALFAQFRRFATPILLGGVIGWGAGNVIRVLVQYIDGPMALGLISAGWAIGQRIASVLAMLLTAAAFPLAVKHYEAGDRQGALSQISFNGLLLLGLLLPACIGLSTLVEPVVTLLIAEKFRETTIAVLPIALCAASLRYLRIHTCEQAMYLIERPQLTIWVLGGEALANIVFCAIGLHWAGFAGAAWGMFLGTALTTLASYIFCFVSLDLPLPAARDVLKIVAACGAMSAALHFAPQTTQPVVIAAAIIVGASVYALALLVLFPQIRASLARRFLQPSCEATP